VAVNGRTENPADGRLRPGRASRSDLVGAWIIWRCSSGFGAPKLPPIDAGCAVERQVRPSPARSSAPRGCCASGRSAAVGGLAVRNEMTLLALAVIGAVIYGVAIRVLFRNEWRT